MKHEERLEAPALPRREGVLADNGTPALNGRATTELDAEGSVAGFHPARLMQDRRKKRPLGWRHRSSQGRGSARNELEWS